MLLLGVGEITHGGILMVVGKLSWKEPTPKPMYKLRSWRQENTLYVSTKQE